jgi:Potato inhibitor I family
MRTFLSLPILTLAVLLSVHYVVSSSPERDLRNQMQSVEHRMSMTPGEWPHLVGQVGSAALETVKKERPDCQVQIVGPGQMVTQDYRLDRVRIYVDADGKVSRPPRTG